MLNLLGGLIGIAVAFGVAYVMNNYTSQHTVINMTVVFSAFAFSGGVGMFFGFYPARKASRLNPIDALRYE